MLLALVAFVLTPRSNNATLLILASPVCTFALVLLLSVYCRAANLGSWRRILTPVLALVFLFGAGGDPKAVLFSSTAIALLAVHAFFRMANHRPSRKPDTR